MWYVRGQRLQSIKVDLGSYTFRSDKVKPYIIHKQRDLAISKTTCQLTYSMKNNVTYEFVVCEIPEAQYMLTPWP